MFQNCSVLWDISTCVVPQWSDYQDSANDLNYHKHMEKATSGSASVKPVALYAGTLFLAWFIKLKQSRVDVDDGKKSSWTLRVFLSRSEYWRTSPEESYHI
ncbi:hypothetical protein CEXT_788681 [Caerostris extrusa]|uniref:Uncharacterized protein n=1 Tax=Caerostris extrusa TaxID=172846 RepID=A0AAV4MLA8_CAEEX|nr:hypothetical protein CEXT_788681 [Caerostris extrusa]